VGTGLGPTLEFFALVSSHVRRRKGITTECIQIWRGDGKVVGEYLNPADGLYPCPITQIEPKIIEFFTNLGKFVAKALFDSRTLDLIFDSLFLEQVFYLSSAPLRLLVLNVTTFI
jgi:E3 ubiquitin-protein ligase TRIP12